MLRWLWVDVCSGTSEPSSLYKLFRPDLESVPDAQQGAVAAAEEVQTALPLLCSSSVILAYLNVPLPFHPFHKTISQLQRPIIPPTWLSPHLTRNLSTYFFLRLCHLCSQEDCSMVHTCILYILPTLLVLMFYYIARVADQVRLFTFHLTSMMCICQEG